MLRSGDKMSSARTASFVWMLFLAAPSEAAQDSSRRDQALLDPAAVNERSLTTMVASRFEEGAAPAAPNPLQDDPRVQTSGDPSWTISLDSLPATSERPILSAARRPPVPAVAPGGSAQALAPPIEPDRPLLALVGTVTRATDGIAIFLQEATNHIVRLKTGGRVSGWTVLKIKGRDVTLEKDRKTVVLSLPFQSIEPTGDAENDSGEAIRLAAELEASAAVIRHRACSRVQSSSNPNDAAASASKTCM
jgi:hypothetical protein